jgi:hypothetical protein
LPIVPLSLIQVHYPNNYHLPLKNPKAGSSPFDSTHYSQSLVFFQDMIDDGCVWDPSGIAFKLLSNLTVFPVLPSDQSCNLTWEGGQKMKSCAPLQIVEYVYRQGLFFMKGMSVI